MEHDFKDEFEPREAYSLLADRKCFLLDVRTVSEYNEAHLKNSVLIPIQELEGREKELPKDKEQTILIYCAHGGRSYRALKWIQHLGYKNAAHMAGGIVDWMDQSLPVETGKK